MERPFPVREPAPRHARPALAIALPMLALMAAAGCSRGPTGASPALMQGTVMTDSGDRVTGAQVSFAFSLALASAPAKATRPSVLDDVPGGPGTPPGRYLRVRNNPCDHGLLAIDFGMPKNGAVKVSVEGARTKTHRMIADRAFAAGNYTMVWDGRDQDGLPLPPGVYTLDWTLTEADSQFHATRTMLWHPPFPQSSANAVTGTDGKFELPLETLPVGTTIDARDANGNDLGRFRIASYVQVCAYAGIGGVNVSGCASTVDVGDRQKDVAVRLRVR